MQPSEIRRALAAATSIAAALGLPVDDVIVLHDSNKLTVRLLPCDLVARVASIAHQVAQFEIGLARRLAETQSPVAALDPGPSRASMRVMASPSRCGPTTNRWHPGTPPRPATPMRSSDCMPACASSMSGRRTSPIGWKRLSTLSRAATSLRILPTQTGSFITTLRSRRRAIPAAAVPSSYCTASRTRATCSARSPDRCHRFRDVLPRPGRIRRRPCPRRCQRALCPR